MGQMVTRLAGHFITYANVKSQCSTPETNIMLYVSCISIKKKKTL